MGKKEKSSELLATLGDFTSKENWDKFFSIRGTGDSFEWYAEWEQLREPLLSYLNISGYGIQILVPGCGNSKLSEHLYDEGFRFILNIDFSKVVISDMLRRNLRVRPEMKWRVMDMTCMQFEDEAFDAVVDKGGLDALMEPQLGPQLGNQYLSEVKRVLKSKGRFVCLTLAESHVIGLLFSKFRFGWEVSIHIIPQMPSENPNLRTFAFVAEKQTSPLPNQITPLFNPLCLDCDTAQGRGVCEALEIENKIRCGYGNDSDITYALEDLKLGVKGNMMDLCPGRRIQLTLDDRYRAVLLDAQKQSDQFMFHCAVFLVPKMRTHEWLFSSVEGQWKVVESSKAARLILVQLDSSHFNANMDEIQKDLSPLVMQLAPKSDQKGAKIPYMTASDGIKHRQVLQQITSSLTGPIVIEDVTYEDDVNVDAASPFPSNELMFRLLTFQRTMNLVQSEALLTKQLLFTESSASERRRLSPSSKSKKKGSSKPKDESINNLKVHHGYLASAYHIGIISGFMLISSRLEILLSAEKRVEAVVVGLGAGLLPMFLHGCMPFLHIKAVELDPIIFDVAKKYFGFVEDSQLEVHIADGIQFIKEVAATINLVSSTRDIIDGHTLPKAGSPSVGNVTYYKEGTGTCKIDVLIIDVDSSDSSSGLTCPAADFVEPCFLTAAKRSLSDHGLLIVNLVTRSAAIRENIISRMKEVFIHIFSLQLEEDVNEVIFALSMEDSISEDQFPDAVVKLKKLLKIERPEMSHKIIESAKKIKCLQ
uniref:Methyltransferase type 11 domain-containing protein n=2 Tax=Kalanchoe fedtschenkoi TaxID=63787 RepID=A0A7N0RBI1_KALFE